jgi:hypothetical protein
MLYCMGCRINFTDDVLPHGDVQDVTDVARAVRDGLCHITSGRSHIGTPNIRLKLSRSLRVGTSVVLEGFPIVNDYADDIAIHVGRNRLYMKRHIERAFDEVVRALEPHMNP